MAATTNFRRCNATLLCSLKRGQTPTQCSFRAKWGAEFCGRHRNFVGRPWNAAPPPPVAPPPPPVAPPPDNTDCSICMDAISGSRTPFTVTPCKHYFHTRCLNQWKARSNMCPCCRASLSTGLNQTNRDRQIATHNFIPPELTNARVNFTPFVPRPRPPVVPPRPVTQPHNYPPPRRFALDIDQVRFMRDTVERGSYEHGYYSAMYQSMLAN
jgi:hypothetical protein